MRLQERRPRQRHFSHEDVIEDASSAERFMHTKVIGGTSKQNTFDRAINTRIPFNSLEAIDVNSPLPFLIGNQWCESFIPEHYIEATPELLTESKHRRDPQTLLDSVVEDYGFPDEVSGTLQLGGILVPFIWGRDTVDDYVLIVMEPADSFICYNIIGCDRIGDSVGNLDCDTIIF